MATSFWTTLSAYCNELAPVVGPLLSTIGNTADAITRASTRTTALIASSDTMEDLMSAADE
jgi:aspartate/glutamate racemase